MEFSEQVRKHTGIVLLVFSGFALTILDLYTSYILELHGFVEANPLMYYLSASHGLWVYIMVNLVISLFLIAFLAWGSVKKLDGFYRYLPMAIYCVVRGAAVVNNVLLL